MTLHGHRTEVASVAFSADGTRLVSTSLNGTVRLWDAVPADERYEARSRQSG